MELFQQIEKTRSGMLEPKLEAGRKVSFERDGLDASKARHIFVSSLLRQLVGVNDWNLADGGSRICALACIHNIVSVFDP